MRLGSKRTPVLTPPAEPPVEFDHEVSPLKISAASIREAVRAKVPPKKKKYDTNERINELYIQWSSGGNHAVNMYDELIYQFYTIYKPRIVSIAKKYRALSPVFDEEDLHQTGHLAIMQALKKYQHSQDIDMKFSTYLEWSIKNVFQRAIGSKDKYVEVYTPDDELYKTMDYHDFQLKKKDLVSAGYHYLVKTKLCYISDIVQAGEQEIPGSAMYDLEHDYMDSFKEKQREAGPAEPQEGARDDERDIEESSNIAAPSPARTSAELYADNGKQELQMIDALYHNWTRQQNGTRQRQYEPTVRSIYDLFKARAIHIADRCHFELIPVNMTEFEQTVMKSISLSIRDYENDKVPGSRFTQYLELKARRELGKTNITRRSAERTHI